MKAFWPDFSYNMYRKACMELNYPKEPFGKYIYELIEPGDVVLDIGCGIGVPAIYVSKLCKSVIALDQNEKALDILSKEIKVNNIMNIDIVKGKWPSLDLEVCDCAISFYAGGATLSTESLIKLVNRLRKGGIITSNGTWEDGGIYKALSERLGVKSREHGCDNGCYLKGKLELLGCKVNCEQIKHDFGQPVQSLEEAVQFLSWQLQLDETYYEKVKKVAPDYIGTRNGGMYISNIRSTCVIIFRK